MTEATLYTAAVKNKQMKYKVISILQPWASLVVLGHKKIETRSWNTKYRGPLLIHASHGKSRLAEQVWIEAMQVHNVTPPYGQYHFTNLPFGAIIGQVNLVDTLPSEYLLNKQFSLTIKGNTFMDKGISEQEKAFGDYSPNRYGWLLSDPVQFPVIIPAKGQLGIWEYDLSDNEGALNHVEQTKLL